MNDISMNHSDPTGVYRELTGCKSDQLNENVAETSGPSYKSNRHFLYL